MVEQGRKELCCWPVMLLLQPKSKILSVKELCFLFVSEGEKNRLLHCLYEISEVAQSCLTLCNPMDSSLQQAPLSMEFSRQEYWNGLPFPSPGNLPNLHLISNNLVRYYELFSLLYKEKLLSKGFF